MPSIKFNRVRPSISNYSAAGTALPTQKHAERAAVQTQKSDRHTDRAFEEVRFKIKASTKSKVNELFDAVQDSSRFERVLD